MLKTATLIAALLLLTPTAWAGSGPSGFPLPKDAAGSKLSPPEGSKVLVFEVPRPKETVLTELRAALKADGWTITGDTTSPRGAVRLVVKKGELELKASLTGDPTKTAIILTLP